MKSKIIGGLFFVLLLSVVVMFFFLSPPQKKQTENGATVSPVSDSGNMVDEIEITNPPIGGSVSSPFTVTGRARGSWFFEAEMPVTLFNGRGEVMVRGTARAQDEWMTEDFVPFEVTLLFDMPTVADGFLLIERSNPSDDRSLDKSYMIPVSFQN